jgi:hypothetical protein
MADEKGGGPVDKSLLLAYLDGRRTPIGQGLFTAECHRAIAAQAPNLYLDLLSDTTAHVSHRRVVLANLLGGPETDRPTVDSVLCRLRILPAEDALAVLDGLRQARRNGRRAREVGLRFLLGHEALVDLAATHRTRLVRLLKHCLGERSWSSVRRQLGGPAGPAVRRRGLFPADLVARLRGKTPAAPEAFLRRTVLKYVDDPARLREVLGFLTGAATTSTQPVLARRLEARQVFEKGAGLPRATLSGLRGTFHGDEPKSRLRFLSAPATDTATARRDGDLTACFKRELLSQGEPAIRLDVSFLVVEAARQLPSVDATLGLVVDLSGSAVSSGERANHPAALGLALTALLRERVRDVRLHQVGGDAKLNGSAFARPQGATDLASAVLAAAREEPEAILVVTDGYENARQGDTAAVVAGLAQLGLAVPVYQVVPLFASTEDLSRRRLCPNVPVLAVEHEREVGELLARVFLAHAPDDLGDDDLDRLRGLLFGGER